MNNPYLFYEVMKYPLPFHKEFFAYEEIINTVKAHEKLSFSRAKPCEGIEEYIAVIHKYEWLRRSLPFVDMIYISGSITFNALQKDSDIDLFVVTSPGRIWFARMMMVFLFWILGIKRTNKKKKQKFRLNFFISRDSLNLQSIKLAPGDPYLIYWLAHLIPLYQRFETQSRDIYEENYRLRDYLPNFPMEHVTSIGSKLFTGDSKIKIGFEKIFGGIFGIFVEKCIKFLSLPFLLRRKKKKGTIGESIILSDKMLKFHADKRKEYAVKWKVMNKMKRGEH